MNNSVGFRWYKKEVSRQFYEKVICGSDATNTSYTILGETGKGLGKKYEVAFLSTKIPVDALEVKDIETLKKIRADRISKNISPLPDITMNEVEF